MNKKLITFIIAIFLSALAALLWNANIPPSTDSPLRALALLDEAAPNCVEWGVDEATGSTEIRCKEETPLRLYVDVEIRVNGTVTETQMTETFIFAPMTPTLPITISLDLSGLQALGELWIRARWDFDPFGEGWTGGMQKDGEILPLDERGFALYDELFKNYLPVIIAVVNE